MKNLVIYKYRTDEDGVRYTIPGLQEVALVAMEPGQRFPTVWALVDTNDPTESHFLVVGTGMGLRDRTKLVGSAIDDSGPNTYVWHVVDTGPASV